MKPNPLLVEIAASFEAGTALDLACGSGGDAVWLAERGWRVTAVDIDPAAVERTEAYARARGVQERVSAERHDLARSFPAGEFDLVTAHYFHTMTPIPRTEILRAGARRLRPGGRLLVVDHGSIAPWSWNQDSSVHFPTPREIADDLGLGWPVLRADSPQRQATGPGGQTAIVTDHVLLLESAA